MTKPVVLVIMDGYGLSDSPKGNAVKMANKPNLDQLMAKYPVSKLVASEEAVGLPKGQMGNSEVGHLNLGAGRVVYQNLTKINMSVERDTLKDEVVIANLQAYAKANGKKVHVLGLLSDGGVHSHIDHILCLLKTYTNAGLETYLHAFLDGRDVSPKSAISYVEKVNHAGYKIATVSGRYYAMDRDKNYDRTAKAFNAMYNGQGELFATAIQGIEASYQQNKLDEFVVPFVCDKKGLISEGDVVIFANFRPDRAIQISTLMTNPAKVDFSNDIHVNFASFTTYSDDVKGQIIFGLETIDNTYGEVISKHGLKQLRIAETEKYAHVTFFFDGGVDKEIAGSKRVLVNSPKVATYDLKPEMSAYEVTTNCLRELDNGYDTVVLNFANCDMVGHTGVIDATIKAVEAVDHCVGQIVDKVLSLGGVCLITADHGNAEKLIEDDGSVYTAHTTNLVPLIVTTLDYKLNDGALCDIAPTMLDLLGIAKPVEMTGKSLITK